MLAQNQKRGKMLAAYYQDLIDHPVFLVPRKEEALRELVTIANKGVTPGQVLALAKLAGPQSSKGWDTVQPGDFHFPGDHGPHNDIRNEWWYLASIKIFRRRIL